MPINISSLSLADARRLIDAGEQKAQQLGMPEAAVAAFDKRGDEGGTRRGA